MQTLLLLVFRHAPKPWVMRIVSHLDRTDYAALAHAACAPNGLLVVTPHHGRFLLSIVAFAERMARTRHVSLFYDAPQDNAGNAMFDALFRKLRDSDTRPPSRRASGRPSPCRGRAATPKPRAICSRITRRPWTCIDSSSN